MVILLSFISFAQQDQRFIAWNNLKSKYSTDGEVFWNEVTKTPEKVYLIKGISAKEFFGIDEVSEQNIEILAKRFIQENKDLIQADVSELYLIKIDKDSSSYDEQIQPTFYVYYGQHYKNLPIYSSLVTIYVIDGRIVSFGSKVYKNINLQINPQIPKENVETIVREFLKDQNAKTHEPSLVIVPETSNDIIYHLAWKVEAFSPLQFDAKRIFIGAIDGKVIKSFSLKKNQISGNVKAVIFPIDQDQPSAIVNVFNQSVNLTVGALLPNTTTNSSGNYIFTGVPSGSATIRANLTGPFVDVNHFIPEIGDVQHTFPFSYPGGTFTHNWIWNETTPPERDRNLEANVFYHLNFIHDYFNKGDPFNISGLNVQTTAIVFFNSTSGDKCNAFASPSFPTPQVGFGSGDNNIVCDNLGLDSDIIIHEYTHLAVFKVYLDNFIDDFNGVGEDHAMDEAFPDYFGATIQNNSEGGAGAFEPYGRILKNNKKYPRDCFGGDANCSNDDGHLNLEILGGAIWDFRDRMIVKYGWPLGRDKVDNFTMKALKLLTHNFSEFLNAMIIVNDNNANLIDGTPDIKEICEGFVDNHNITSNITTGPVLKLCPVIESSNVVGQSKELFEYGENVYVRGFALPVNQLTRIYIVNNSDNWQNGLALNDVSGGFELVSTNAQGILNPILVWSNAQSGGYDIVLDINQNGIFDVATDIIDDNETSELTVKILANTSNFSIDAISVFQDGSLLSPGQGKILYSFRGHKPKNFTLSSSPEWRWWSLAGENVKVDEIPNLTFGLNTFPHIAFLSNGSAIATWSNFQNCFANIYYSIFDGNKWTNPVNVTQASNLTINTQPALAFDTNGKGILVWERFNMTDDPFFGCVVSPPPPFTSNATLFFKVWNGTNFVNETQIPSLIPVIQPQLNSPLPFDTFGPEIAFSSASVSLPNNITPHESVIIWWQIKGPLPCFYPLDVEIWPYYALWNGSAISQVGEIPGKNTTIFNSTIRFIPPHSGGSKKLGISSDKLGNERAVWAPTFTNVAICSVVSNEVWSSLWNGTIDIWREFNITLNNWQNSSSKKFDNGTDFVDISLDSINKAHAVYYAPPSVKWSKNNGTIWDIVGVNITQEGKPLPTIASLAHNNSTAHWDGIFFSELNHSTNQWSPTDLIGVGMISEIAARTGSPTMPFIEGTENVTLPPDITPPIITILSPQNISYNVTTLPLQFTINEPFSWIAYSLDNGPNVTISGNTTLSSLSQGPHNVIVYANDTSNNTGSSGPVFFTIDTTKPILTFIPPTPINITISVNFAFINLTSNEPLSSATLEWNGTNETMSGSSTLFFKNKTSLANGNYTFRAFGTDLAGNSNSTSLFWILVNVTVPDITPPTIIILSPQNITYNTNSIPLTFTINESTSWIGYSLDNQPNVTVSGNITLSALSDGSHNIKVYANDTSGNMGVSNTIFFTIDTTLPLLTFVSPTPINQIITQNFAFINVTSNEPLSSAILEWNGTNESMLGSGINWFKNKTNLANGNYTFRAFGTDLAVNQNKTDMKWVFVNVTIPPLTCGSTITQNTTLTTDLICPNQDGVIFGANNTTLDCNNKKIIGNNTFPFVGIKSNNKNNIKIINCHVESFYEGIYVNITNNSKILNSSARKSSQRNFVLERSSNDTVINFTSNDNNLGVVSTLLFLSNNNLLENINGTNSTITLVGSSKNTLKDVTLTRSSSLVGISGDTQSNISSNDNLLTSWTLKGSSFNGISIGDFIIGGPGAHNNTIKDSIIINNSVGIFIFSTASNNKIFNNFFNNSINAQNSGSQNFWNITKTSGINIIGGPFLGGNFWHDYTGVDTNGDGLGDTLLPYNSSNNIMIGGDFLPLVLLTCGSTIIQNNTLTSNLVCNGTALTIGTNNITLDCNSNTITGNSSGVGILAQNKQNITIKNCVIKNFTEAIKLISTTKSFLLNNTVSQNNFAGFALQFSANNNTFISNLAQNNNIGFALTTSSSNNTLINNTANSNTNGFDLSGVFNNSLTNNTANNNQNGFSVTTSSNNTLINNTANSNTNIGFVLAVSNSTLLTNNTANNNSFYGFHLFNSLSNTLINNTANKSLYGFFLQSASNVNNLFNNTAQNNSIGFFLDVASFNFFSFSIVKNNNLGFKLNTTISNTITSSIFNNTRGINITNSLNNFIYNNFFNNTLNAKDDSNNFWNIAKTPGTNIIGGPFLGGNFWHDYNGTDTSGDGLGDTFLPYNSNGNIINGGDFLPLVLDITPPTIQILSPQNITYNKTKINLTFTLSEPASWIGYRRDNLPNITISNNTTITVVNASNHNIKVYANDTSGNMGVSNTVFFKSCVGDVNGDGIINIFDAAALGIAYGSTSSSPNYNANADFEPDGDVDIFDAVVLAINYNKNCNLF